MSTVVDMRTSQSGVRTVFDRVAALAPALAQTSAEQRIEKIQRLVQAMLAHKEEIHAAVRTERGLGPVDTDGELVMVKFEADFIAANLKHWMPDRPVDPSLMSLGKRCYVHYEPKGVVLHLATWNAPYVIGFLPVLGALAAGNAVILKPSELAPHSSALVAKIAAAAFPGGEVTVVEGGAQTAQELLACPFNHIFYVGNTQIGKLVMKAAADHCASLTLEMGGKNPSIVGASADIADTAMKTAWGRMVNGGQACIAPDYVLVHASVEQSITQALAREFTAQYNSDGKGFAQNPDYPLIINERHFNRVRALIEDARAKGATIVCGGEYVPEKRLVTPTIISKVTDDMRVMHEEIFGPVLCMVPYRTKEEVTRYVASRDKPLALYIFSKDQAEIDYHIAHTTSGSTMINHNVMQTSNPYLPFGGVNASGMGRMGGWHTFNECSNARAVVIDGTALGDPRAFVPPFTDKFKRQVSGLLTQKPVPRAIVKLIHGVLKLKGLF